jgi:hypothetical protein
MPDPPIVMRGNVGWGNRKNGVEAYGPGGRWEGNEFGDLLGDALERAGAYEGARFVVVAINRFGDESLLAAVEEFVAEHIDGSTDA